MENALEDLAVIGSCSHQKVGEGDNRGVVGFIRDGADAQEGHLIDFAGVGDGGGFHIGAETVVGVPEFAGFFGLADELIASENTTIIYFGGMIAEWSQFGGFGDLDCQLRETRM